MNIDFNDIADTDRDLNEFKCFGFLMQHKLLFLNLQNKNEYLLIEKNIFT